MSPCVARLFSLSCRLRLTIWVTSFGLNAFGWHLAFYPIYLGLPNGFLRPRSSTRLTRLHYSGL